MRRTNKGNTAHGLSRTGGFYDVWRNLKARCDNPNRKDYKNYGGRGISYDPRWKSFLNFQADMAARYKNGLQLDRVDNNCNYSRENCRWVTKEEQNRNKSTCHYIEFNGQRKTIVEWSEITGINFNTLHHRVVDKWPTELALTTPAKRGNDRYKLIAEELQNRLNMLKEPLSKNEVVQIMEANKHGFLSDDQATDLLSNPNQARQYLAKDYE